MVFILEILYFSQNQIMDGLKIGILEAIIPILEHDFRNHDFSTVFAQELSPVLHAYEDISGYPYFGGELLQAITPFVIDNLNLLLKTREYEGFTYNEVRGKMKLPLQTFLEIIIQHVALVDANKLLLIFDKLFIPLTKSLSYPSGKIDYPIVERVMMVLGCTVMVNSSAFYRHIGLQLCLQYTNLSSILSFKIIDKNKFARWNYQIFQLRTIAYDFMLQKNTLAQQIKCSRAVSVIDTERQLPLIRNEYYRAFCFLRLTYAMGFSDFQFQQYFSIANQHYTPLPNPKDLTFLTLLKTVESVIDLYADFTNHSFPDNQKCDPTCYISQSWKYSLSIVFLSPKEGPKPTPDTEIIPFFDVCDINPEDNIAPELLVDL